MKGIISVLFLIFAMFGGKMVVDGHFSDFEESCDHPNDCYKGEVFVTNYDNEDTTCNGRCECPCDTQLVIVHNDKLQLNYYMEPEIIHEDYLECRLTCNDDCPDHLECDLGYVWVPSTWACCDGSCISENSIEEFTIPVCSICSDDEFSTPSGCCPVIDCPDNSYWERGPTDEDRCSGICICNDIDCNSNDIPSVQIDGECQTCEQCESLCITECPENFEFVDWQFGTCSHCAVCQDSPLGPVDCDINEDFVPWSDGVCAHCTTCPFLICQTEEYVSGTGVRGICPTCEICDDIIPRFSCEPDFYYLESASRCPVCIRCSLPEQCDEGRTLREPEANKCQTCEDCPYVGHNDCEEPNYFVPWTDGVCAHCEPCPFVQCSEDGSRLVPWLYGDCPYCDTCPELLNIDDCFENEYLSQSVGGICSQCTPCPYIACILGEQLVPFAPTQPSGTCPSCEPCENEPVFADCNLDTTFQEASPGQCANCAACELTDPNDCEGNFTPWTDGLCAFCFILPATSAPTTAPTSAPTTAPTSAPTTAPTSAPTTAPTSAPTTAPTSAPTTAPTSAPTSAPTTSAPTTSPLVPTTAPTPLPTPTPFVPP